MSALAALARAYGAESFRITRTDEFASAFDEAASLKAPSLIHVRIDPEAISPATTLSKLRESGRRKG